MAIGSAVFQSTDDRLLDWKILEGDTDREALPRETNTILLSVIMPSRQDMYPSAISQLDKTLTTDARTICICDNPGSLRS